MTPWPCLLDARGPALGVALGAGRVPRAADAEPPVRARAAAGVFAVTPVEEVVAAFLARRGVVGDLVGRQPRRGRQLLRRLVERERGVLVGDDELAGGVQRGERRLRLDGELVERQVLPGEASASRSSSFHAVTVCPGRA